MAEFIDTLINTYRNEINTKTLLPYNTRLMEYIKRNIPKQIEYLSTLTEYTVIKTIIMQELECIKYFTCEYLLCRMKKMQNHFNIDESFLSDAEKIYYSSLMTYFKKENVFIEVEKATVDENEFVAFVCLIENRNVVIDFESVSLKYGDFFVAPLKDVFELLLRNEICLV